MKQPHAQLLRAGMLLSVCLSAAPHVLAQHPLNDPSHEPAAGERLRGQLIRVLQYEALLGDPLSAELGLCLDESQDGRPVPDAGGPETLAAARRLAPIRRAAEACALSLRGGTDPTQPDTVDTTRLVGGLRARLEGLRTLAAALLTLKPCLQGAQRAEDTHRCFHNATGALPTLEEQQQLATLFLLSRP